MTTLLLNGVRAVSVRLLTPERGAWIADVDLDPDVTGAAAPTSGAATLQIGDQALVGTIDPRAAGRFAGAARVRVVAGGGGWDKTVSRNAWHNDAGVKSTLVYGATAAQVGETINEASPRSLGADYVRMAGSAARVFGAADWYVDLAGVTQVASRPAATPDAALQILSYDAGLEVLEVGSDLVVLPGTAFTDARFDGTLVARDVEQTFGGDSGGRATVFVATEKLAGVADVLRTAVAELGGLALLRVYRYRFISATVDRLNVQAVDKGAPDLTPIPVMPGMAGLSAKLTPSQTVLVAFLNGDPTLPVVVGFDGNLPREVSIDATDKVHIAPSGGAPAPIARLGDAVSVFMPTGMLPIAGIINPGAQAFAGTIQVTVPSAVGVIVGGSGKADCGT